MYEIRDPVHQTISFDEKEKAVIDHPVFQRMRYVRQLGLSYLVYPGAVHDRFSHMLGAMHIAGRVWDNIMRVSGEELLKEFSKKDLEYFRECVRFAALMHDVGHAPFSHVSEKLMPELGALELPKDWYRDWKPKRASEHEDFSVLMIYAVGHDPETPIDEAQAQDVASLIHHGIRPSDRWKERYGEKSAIHGFLSSMISGELDADRMDYLQRDAHFTGVAYGVYDMDHLVRNIGLVVRDGRISMTIDSTAVRAFEDFLLARYHMFLQVYHHKTTNGFDYFLKQAFGSGEVEITIPGTIEGYLNMRDSTFLEALFEAAQDPAKRWSRRFVHRKPAKRLFAASGDDKESRELMRKLRAHLDEAKVPYFTINSHQYLSKLDPDRARKRGESEMLVREKRLGQLVYTPVQRYSMLLKKYNEIIDMVNLYVLPEEYEAAMKAIRPLIKTE